jgi:hypothetical protein
MRPMSTHSGLFLVFNRFWEIVNKKLPRGHVAKEYSKALIYVDGFAGGVAACAC